MILTYILSLPIFIFSPSPVFFFSYFPPDANKIAKNAGRDVVMPQDLQPLFVLETLGGFFWLALFNEYFLKYCSTLFDAEGYNFFCPDQKKGA